MYGFIVVIRSALPFIAFSQGDTYVFTYSFLFFSFAETAALELSVPEKIFKKIKTEALHRKPQVINIVRIFTELLFELLQLFFLPTDLSG